MLAIVEAKSITEFIPMMLVPNFEVGEKICDRLSEMNSNIIYAMVSGFDPETSKIPHYSEWSWD